MVGKHPPSVAEFHPIKSHFAYYMSLEQAMAAVEKHAETTDTTFAMLRSDPNFGKSVWNNDDFKVKWSEGEKAVGEPLPFDGIPFLLLGTRHLGCQFVNEKAERAIKRANLKKNVEWNTEKCPAKIILKEVIKFPDYKIPSNNKKDMLKWSQILRNDLKHSAAVMQPRIYVEFPKPEAHSHAIGGKRSKGVSKPSKNCLVCNANFSSSTRATVDIFSDVARTSHRQLEVHSVLSEVLKQNLVAQNLYSTTICNRCFNLLDDIDSLEEQLDNKKQTMAERYSRTTKLVIGNTEAADNTEDEIGNDEDDSDILYGKRPRIKTAKRGRPVGRPRVKGPGRPRVIPHSTLLQKSPEKNYATSPQKPSLKTNDIFKKISSFQKIAEPCNITDSLDISQNAIVKIETDEENVKSFPVSILSNMNAATILKSIKSEAITSEMESPYEKSEDKDGIVAVVENDDMADQISVELQGDVLEVVGEVLEREKLQIKNENHLYSCSECDKKFNTKAAIRNHIKVHTYVHSFACEVCGKAFFNKHRFLAHMKTHKDREKSHTCNLCHKSYYTSYHLNTHLKTHSEQNLYVCDVCGKSLSTQKTLDLHALTHSGERPFQCEICGATFRQRSNLHTHIKATHFREKNHACEICNKSFVRKRLLVYHMNSVHTGERPYKCEFCATTFVYPHYYKRHLRKHNGEKPFKCQICSKQFSSKENRNAHLFIHSNKRPYECKICGAGFMRKPLCVAHVASHSYAENPEANIIFNSPSQMVNASEAQMSEENIIITADEEVERAVETVRMVEGTVTESSNEFYTVRDDKVVKVMSRPVHIIESEDRTRFVIHTGDRRDENMEHFFAALQGQVVEVQTEDF